jgi:hypothetical protein
MGYRARVPARRQQDRGAPREPARPPTTEAGPIAGNHRCSQPDHPASWPKPKPYPGPAVIDRTAQYSGATVRVVSGRAPTRVVLGRSTRLSLTQCVSTQLSDVVEVRDTASCHLWRAVGAHLIGVLADDAVHAGVPERGVVGRRWTRRWSIRESWGSERPERLQCPTSGTSARRPAHTRRSRAHQTVVVGSARWHQ